MTGALDAEDLRWEAVAMRAVAKARSGDKPAAVALAESIPKDRVGRRVFAAWALSYCDHKKVDAEAFPGDRGVLSRAVRTSLDGLAKRDGAADVSDLMLVERYVDALQRRFATALKQSKPALAVKMREAAEDKSASAAPSARNRLPGLLHTALDNVGIERPRVALKYLTRASERLPAVAGAVEMLRDLLTLRSMQSGGGATTGQ